MDFIKDKVVLVGGSFNPPTLAHKQMIKELMKYHPKKILIVPNGNQYNVSFVNKTLIEFNDRKNMCNLMMKDLDVDYEVLDIENTRSFKGSYYTLQELNHPTFIMGSDCLESLHKWIKYEELVEENKFVVFSRSLEIEKMKSLLEEDEYLKSKISHFEFLKMNLPNVSSSLFRSTKDSSLVDKLVYEYIIKNNLYEVKHD